MFMKFSHTSLMMFGRIVPPCWLSASHHSVILLTPRWTLLPLPFSSSSSLSSQLLLNAQWEGAAPACHFSVSNLHTNPVLSVNAPFLFLFICLFFQNLNTPYLQVFKCFGFCPLFFFWWVRLNDHAVESIKYLSWLTGLMKVLPFA